MSLDKIASLLGDQADYLLKHESKTISRDRLHLPGADFVDRVWTHSNRSSQVLRSLEALYNHGRLGGSGYMSILPVDQGIEHSAGASFAPNTDYFDAEHIVKLAIFIMVKTPTNTEVIANAPTIWPRGSVNSTVM